jgi:hypothetical protein
MTTTDKTDEWKNDKSRNRRVNIIVFAQWIMIPFLIAACVITLIVSIFWTGVRTTEVDRHKREVTVRECGEIEDETTRSACLRDTD